MLTRTAAGVFDTYAAAGAVVRELELLGISGGQVEVVSDAARDLRGIGVVPRSQKENSDSVSEDYTMVIVRPSDDRGMEQAKTLMDRYGARQFRWQISAEAAPIASGASETTPQSSIGGRATTGAVPADLEGRGKQIEVHGADWDPANRPN